MIEKIDCYASLLKGDNNYVSFRYNVNGDITEQMNAPVAAAIILHEVQNVIRRVIPDYSGKNTCIAVCVMVWDHFCRYQCIGNRIKSNCST